MKVSVGPSTIAMIIGALGAATAFIVGWVETGTAPVWLAGIAAGLAAVMAWLRSWQAVNMNDVVVPEFDVVDDVDDEPTDFPGA